jgi:hypothetical protein
MATINSLETKASKMLATFKKRIESGKTLTFAMQERVECLNWDMEELSCDLLSEGKQDENNELVDRVEMTLLDELQTIANMTQKDVDAHNAKPETSEREEVFYDVLNDYSLKRRTSKPTDLADYTPVKSTSTYATEWHHAKHKELHYVSSNCGGLFGCNHYYA